jgi:hypothetical protein
MKESIADKEAVPLHKYYHATVDVSDTGRMWLDGLTLPYIYTAMVIPKTPHPIPKMGITKIL